MTVADVLNGAADLIERDGWIQGQMRSPQGRCMYGAIKDAVESMGGDEGLLIRSTAAARPRRKYMGLSPWNDVPGRSQAEVVAALRAAAARAA